MRETELTEIGRELAKYFNARPSDDTWDGFGFQYTVDRDRAPAHPTSTGNVRYMADYTSADEPAPLPPVA